MRDECVRWRRRWQSASRSEILPSSTGIIGHLLPMEKIERGIRGAAANLGKEREHADQFAAAILTTDLKRKAAATTVKIGRGTVTLAGVCKGSGMIGPRMALPGKALHATMLAYLTTDAAIAAPLLRKLLGAASDAQLQRRHRRRPHEHERHGVHLGVGCERRED